MINQVIQLKIDEVTRDLDKIRLAPQDPTARRAVVREVVGDAEIYLENLLAWLRKL